MTKLQKDFLSSFFTGCAIVMVCAFFFTIGFNMSKTFTVTTVPKNVLTVVDRICWNRGGVVSFSFVDTNTHAKVSTTCTNGDVVVKWISLSQQEK